MENQVTESELKTIQDQQKIIQELKNEPIKEVVELEDKQIYK